MLKKVSVLTPQTFNDGTAVPKSAVLDLQDEIYALCGGWALAGKVTGAYQMQRNRRKKVEKLLEYWIVLEEGKLRALRRLISKYAAIFRQEAIYFAVTDEKVEFIPPQTKKGVPND